MSGVISRDEFISGLVEQGHAIDDVNSFQKFPEPAIKRSVRWRPPASREAWRGLPAPAAS